MSLEVLTVGWRSREFTFAQSLRVPVEKAGVLARACRFEAECFLCVLVRVVVLVVVVRVIFFIGLLVIIG